MGLFKVSSFLGFLTKAFKLLVFYVIFLQDPRFCVDGTECMKRKYYEITVSYFGGVHINRTQKCDMYFQWTVADFCCYDKYDRFERNPFCCYSETYKLVLAVSFICLVLFIGTFSIFFCWVYNLPHHLLYIFTCGKFHLNNWLLKNKNGTYVDPSYYGGEPFWARGAEIQPYPLRPMPPKIFYPAPPPKLKYRWDASNCEIPLFIIASRQFTRNPYSARPQDRNSHNHSSNVAQLTNSSYPESRRSSLSSNYNGSSGGNGGGGSITPSHSDSASQQFARRDSNSAPGIFRRGSSALLQQRGVSGSSRSKNPPQPFKVNMDEMEATAELIEALKTLDEGINNSNPEPNLNTRLSPTPPKVEDPLDELDEDEEGGTSEDVYNVRVRPNTTDGSGCLDQYGNYVSLSGLSLNANTLQQQLSKPNTALLNQQLTNLRLPVYSMPGVHTANVLTTVQNYHVVSSNLGNPMETILEDDSLDDEYNEGGGSDRLPKRKSPSPAPKLNTSNKKRGKDRPPLKRRATIVSSLESRRNSIDHVVVPTPTQRAVVPFNPTLPGSLSDADSSTFDMDHKDKVKSRRELRRNSVI